jgi:aldehyde:ferredoxin oxidoreductase
MPIVLGAGLLNGTACPSAPKSFLTTKCPSTGTVSTAVGSLHLGAVMRWAGYEHIVIKGKSERPVYLHVDDANVQVRDASDLWGQDIYEATDRLRARHGGESKVSVVCIGPAGENLCRTSMVLIDKCSTLGRTNAANFASKNLKAVVINGSAGVSVADPKRFMKTADELFGKAWQDPLRPMWTHLHLFTVLPVWLDAGHIVGQNYTECARTEDINKYFGQEEYLKFKRKTISCPACLAADKGVLVYEDQQKETYISTPLEILQAHRFGVQDMNTAIDLFDRANRYGIDYMTFTALLDFTVDLYDKGIITTEDTDGLALKPDLDTISRAMELVKANEGFGRILSQGWIGAVKEIGRGCEEYAHHIKGTEPDFDARASFGVEVLGQVTNPRGAHDMPIGGLTVAPGRDAGWFEKVVKKMGFPPSSLERIFVEPGFDVAKLLAHYENWATVLNSLGICFRMQSSRLFSIEICAELYSAATGVETGPEELRESAERAYNVYKMLNVREGFDRKDDSFPRKWFEPLKSPDRPEPLVAKDYFLKADVLPEDTARILDSYYEEKGWDLETGIPTASKLEELGLRELIADIP